MPVQSSANANARTLLLKTRHKNDKAVVQRVKGRRCTQKYDVVCAMLLVGDVLAFEGEGDALAKHAKSKLLIAESIAELKPPTTAAVFDKTLEFFETESLKDWFPLLALAVLNSVAINPVDTHAFIYEYNAYAHRANIPATGYKNTDKDKTNAMYATVCAIKAFDGNINLVETRECFSKQCWAKTNPCCQSQDKCIRKAMHNYLGTLLLGQEHAGGGICPSKLCTNRVAPLPYTYNYGAYCNPVAYQPRFQRVVYAPNAAAPMLNNFFPQPPSQQQPQPQQQPQQQPQPQPQLQPQQQQQQQQPPAPQPTVQRPPRKLPPLEEFHALTSKLPPLAVPITPVPKEQQNEPNTSPALEQSLLTALPRDLIEAILNHAFNSGSLSALVSTCKTLYTIASPFQKKIATVARFVRDVFNYAAYGTTFDIGFGVMHNNTTTDVYVTISRGQVDLDLYFLNRVLDILADHVYNDKTIDQMSDALQQWYDSFDDMSMDSDDDHYDVLVAKPVVVSVCVGKQVKTVTSLMKPSGYKWQQKQSKLQDAIDAENTDGINRVRLELVNIAEGFKRDVFKEVPQMIAGLLAANNISINGNCNIFVKSFEEFTETDDDPPEWGDHIYLLVQSINNPIDTDAITEANTNFKQYLKNLKQAKDDYITCCNNVALAPPNSDRTGLIQNRDQSHAAYMALRAQLASRFMEYLKNNAEQVLEHFNSRQQQQQEGGTIVLLGRRRKVVQKGRSKYAMHKGQLCKLSELKKLDAQHKKARRATRT